MRYPPARAGSRLRRHTALAGSLTPHPWRSAMIYLLVGPDRYLLECELKRILAELDPDTLSTTRYDKSSSLAEVSSAVATAGFFGSGRVIVAEGVMARTSGTGKAKKAEVDDVETLFLSVAPGN